MKKLLLLHISAVFLSLFSFSIFLCDRCYPSPDIKPSYAMFGIGMPELIVIIFILAIIVLPLWALIDIIKAEFTGSNKVIWILVVLLLPLIGSILYFAIGKNQKTYRVGMANAQNSEQLRIQKPDTKKCPFCAEEIKFEAIKCKHCGSSLQ